VGASAPFMKLKDYAIKHNKFVPLTYLEAVTEKPLIIKLTDKWHFVSYPQKAINFAQMVNHKDYILQLIGSALEITETDENSLKQKSARLINGINKLIELLFEISKQEYPDKEKEYREFLFEYGLDNTDIMTDILKKVLEINTRLEKKNRVIDKLQGVSRPGPVDRWSGFFAGRRDLQTTTFIQLVIEAEEKARAQEREYENAKKNQPKKGNKSLPKLR
jgi:hypothetical protein